MNLLAPIPDFDSHIGKFRHEHHKRVIAYDPTPLSEIIQSSGAVCERYFSVSKNKLFPHRNNGRCACGCGRATKMLKNGNFRKYAPDVNEYGNNICQLFTTQVWAIIAGKLDFVRFYLTTMYGEKCAACGLGCDGLLYVDHIVPVAHGGGRSWLTNYQLLCADCHKIKTCRDFGWRKRFASFRYVLRQAW